MPFTRRQFLRAGGALAAGTFVLGRRLSAHDHADSLASALDLNSLPPFVDALPILPRASATGTVKHGTTAEKLFALDLRSVEVRIHRDVPPTTFWSFGSTFPGPTIEARHGEGLWVDWINRLPASHFLPIDRAIAGAEKSVPDVRAVVHLHGGRVPPESDGHAEMWTVPGQTSRYHYPNHQDATTLWYHDHTMGINRLNVYAGLMGAYVIHDDVEDALNLPKGDFDIPLILCDRLFREDGQLDYPISPDPESPWVPDVSGDALLVNGKLTPYLDVEARKYRFRFINGSNARFLRLELSNGSPFAQIGTDQGLLPAPVSSTMLTLAPAERVDVVVDFAAFDGDVVLTNDRRPITQFRRRRGQTTDPSALPARLRPLEPVDEALATTVRTHMLGEVQNLLEQPVRMLLNSTRWAMPVTERPTLGSTEIWNLANVTDDSHPIHLHLVRFRILDRQKFDPVLFFNHHSVVFTGPRTPPDPSEAGWKDTVRAEPGMITRIAVTFDGYAGMYMWHCHILEHSDNEMMRPMEIVAGA